MFLAALFQNGDLPATFPDFNIVAIDVLLTSRDGFLLGDIDEGNDLHDMAVLSFEINSIIRHLTLLGCFASQRLVTFALSLAFLDRQF